MIILNTGSPGSGKTLNAVSRMLKWQKDERPLYVHGVTDLDIPHNVVECDLPECSFCQRIPRNVDTYPMATWFNWCEKNSVLIFDEVQHQWRNRPAGSKVPEYITALETHRHKGVDFLLITQYPGLIDQNVRKLITEHNHFKAKPMGVRTKYTWTECKEDPRKDQHLASQENYRLDQKLYKYYKSAELHTKFKFKIPRPVYYLAAAVSVAAFMFFRIQNEVNEDIEPQSTIQTAQPSQNFIINEQVITEPDLQKFNFTPAISNVYESAPAFNDLVTVTTYPRRAGCISTRTRCKCYTDQGTEYPTTEAVCRAFIQNTPFNPYKGDSELGNSEPRAINQPPQESVDRLSGAL